MSKLPASSKFIDLSDYGRGIAKSIAKSLLKTHFTPIHVTMSFIVAGLLAISFIYIGAYWLAGFFLILKSILDAADGELARLRERPSYVGRYFDSIADIILNGLIFLCIWLITSVNWYWVVLAFVGLQLQGTLYNYYYVILRNQLNGDKTSRIFETKVPTAMPGESQKKVTLFYYIYKALYGFFDKVIYRIDPKAPAANPFPKWFMTLLSTFGLGFQLLLIGVFLVSGLIDYIIPFFLYYSLLILVFVLIRKNLGQHKS